MKYYSINHKSPDVSLSEAVIRGLAPDGGLYMPRSIDTLPKALIRNLRDMSLQESSYIVASTLFRGDIEADALKNIVDDTLNFDIPLRQVDDNIYALELYHGPTLAFKDVGARFLARTLQYFNSRLHPSSAVNVLVATSGDSGSAVANGFLNVSGINVFILYPEGQLSKMQEAQFTSLGANIHPLEVGGSFDDCQSMVKSALADPTISRKLHLTSANSINPARLLPHSFYYFWAYAQLQHMLPDAHLQTVFSVPSGNLGNLCAGLIAHRMGLPVKRFVAANNINNVFVEYLSTGKYTPRASQATVAHAMDVGAPSNFARIAELYGTRHSDIAALISGYSYTDKQIIDAIHDVHASSSYILDPHGATAYLALKDSLRPGETGIFLETAHPAKFCPTVEAAIGKSLDIPHELARLLSRKKESTRIAPTPSALKRYLLDTIS